MDFQSSEIRAFSQIQDCSDSFQILRSDVLRSGATRKPKEKRQKVREQRKQALVQASCFPPPTSTASNHTLTHSLSRFPLFFHASKEKVHTEICDANPSSAHTGRRVTLDLQSSISSLSAHYTVAERTSLQDRRVLVVLSNPFLNCPVVWTPQGLFGTAVWGPAQCAHVLAPALCCVDRH